MKRQISNIDIAVLKDKNTARQIGEFLTGPYTFEQKWSPNEKKFVMQACLESLEDENHRYWYIKDGEKIIAALGMRENKYGSGGYEMDQDYFAVHKDYRRKGLATKLLEEAEKFVKNRDGRYIHVLTCDIESYKPANIFYKKHGYKKMGEIPNYYVESEGRIDYFKEFK